MIVENGHVSPEEPRGSICTKFGTSGLLADLITGGNYFGNRPRGFDSVRGRILPLSYLQAVAINTVLALPRSL